MNRLRIAIIVGFIDFPMVGAAAKRILLLARGLSECGAEINVFPIGRLSNQSDIAGFFQGIHYEYIKNTIYKPGSRVSQIDNLFGLSIITSARILADHLERSRSDIVIVYSRDIILLNMVAKVARKLKVPLILEICEWPGAKQSDNLITSLRRKIFVKYSLGFANGVIPISSYIDSKVKEYENKHNRRLPSCKVPVLVDTGEFDEPVNQPENYFLYAGGPGYFDILKMVLEGFRGLDEDFRNLYSLYIVGLKSKTRDAKLLIELSREMGIFDQVKLTEYVSWDFYKQLLANATGLLIPLPNDDRSKARFPNKIGEYLAAGRPVITTNVGEINYYLTNQVNAYIAGHTDKLQFQEQLNSVIKQPEHAFGVGLAGRNLAKGVFDYRIYGKKLFDFVGSISYS